MKKQFQQLLVTGLALLLTSSLLTADSELLSPADDSKELPAAGEITVRLTTGESITGFLLGPSRIQVFVLGNKLTVPIENILGINLPNNTTDQAVVILKNRDQLTGHVQLDDIKLGIRWGEIKIHRAHIKEVMSSHDLQWTKITTPNGIRWGVSTKTVFSSSDASTWLRGLSVPWKALPEESATMNVTPVSVSPPIIETRSQSRGLAQPTAQLIPTAAVLQNVEVLTTVEMIQTDLPVVDIAQPINQDNFEWIW